MNVLEFGAALLGNTFGEHRFVRLTPFQKPWILFFDKQERKFLKINSRSRIDSITANQIFTQEDYSVRRIKRHHDIQRQYHSIIESGKVPLIIDCGCNIGLSSYYFSKIYPASRIIGIEPSAENVEMAKKICGPLGNISIKQAAIGSKEGFVEIKNQNADANKFEVTHSADASIPLLTIPMIQREVPNHELFIVKVDIEGFEKDLFSNNTEWIDECFTLFVEPHDWMFPKEQTIRNFLSVISGYDRDFIIFEDNIISIKN